MPTADSLAYLASKAASKQVTPPTSTTSIDPNAGSTIAGAPLTGSFNRSSSMINNDTAGMTIQQVDAMNAQKAPGVTPWTLEGDPLYQSAMANAASQFNLGKANAMSDLNATTMAKGVERRNLDVNATEARRRTAGNYAARGMAGGAAGALTLAEQQANAKQITAQTDIKDQISALNANFLQNYGAVGSDWTGTLAGQALKTQAAQAAITGQLSKYGATA
jgi:hypothetical protein